MADDKASGLKKLVDKLRNKYRLVILNDETFEEKLSLKLNRLNVFFIVGFLTIFLITATIFLIAFTPLREYIPGYSSTKLRQEAFNLAVKTDSIERQLAYNRRYLLNIRKVLEGKPPVNFADTAFNDSMVEVELRRSITREDSMLRQLVEEEERFNLTQLDNEINKRPSFSFFTPVKGLVTNEFSPGETHLGVDIVARREEMIKAVQDGIVVFSEWTSETGYVIIVQHAKDFISVYKHNSALLKEQGEAVEAGEPIAVIGNSGELTTGPHLHFELWYQGTAVNPENYISF